MNNFRRSIREVVFVVKTSDATVLQRLAEFKKTTAGQLTIDEFQQFSKRLKMQHDPPSFYMAQQKADRLERQKQKARSRPSDLGSEPVTRESSVVDDEQREDTTASPEPVSDARKRKRDSQVVSNDVTMVDADATETTSELDSLAQAHDTDGPNTSQSRKKKGVAKRPAVVITEDDLMQEEALEDEIETLLDFQITDEMLNSTLIHATAEAEARRGESTVPDPTEIDETEFDDDPEVANCLLSEAEIAVKEKIWVTLNADWLRAQQMKQILKEKSELLDGVRGPVRKRRKGCRTGDGSLLRESGPVSSAAEATARMLEKRLGPNASKKVNYNLLRRAYGGTEEDMNRSLERVEKAREEKRAKDSTRRKELRQARKARAAAMKAAGDGSVLSPSATPEPDDDDDDDEDESDEEVDEAEGEDETVMDTSLDQPATARGKTQLPTPSSSLAKPNTQTNKGGKADDELEVVEEFDDDGRGEGGEEEEVVEVEEDEDDDEDDDEDEGAYDDPQEPAWQDLGFEMDEGDAW